MHRRAGLSLLAALCVAACHSFPDHDLAHLDRLPAGVLTWTDEVTAGLSAFSSAVAGASGARACGGDVIRTRQ